MSFDEEFVTLLREHGVEFDPKFVFCAPPSVSSAQDAEPTLCQDEAVKKPNVQNGPENLSQLEVLRAIIHTSPDIFLIQKMYEKQGK